jgi:pimeloyl-ACP methyl ester carboxylesterase
MAATTPVVGRPCILFVPPLFEEANRLRRTLVMTMRALAQLGYDSLFPDLPGQNDSLTPTENVTLDDWRSALRNVARAEDAPVIVASWRGGALIDHAADNAIGWWRMSPVAGASLVKTMLRTRIAGEKEAGRSINTDTLRTQFSADGIGELGGNILSAAMLDMLDSAVAADVGPLRQVQPGEGSDRITGSALWLRAEPGEDPAMARAMAADIADWASQCANG